MSTSGRSSLEHDDFVLELPPSWVALDLDDPPTKGLHGEIAADALARSAIAAAAHVHEDRDVTTAAALFVHKSSLDEGSSLDALRAELEEEKPGDITPRGVERFLCAVGEGVRVSVMVTQPLDEPSGLVVELVQHWVPFESGRGALVLSWSTPCLAFGEAYAAAYDDSAATLRLGLPDTAGRPSGP